MIFTTDTGAFARKNRAKSRDLRIFHSIRVRLHDNGFTSARNPFRNVGFRRTNPFKIFTFLPARWQKCPARGRLLRSFLSMLSVRITPTNHPTRIARIYGLLWWFDVVSIQHSTLSFFLRLYALTQTCLCGVIFLMAHIDGFSGWFNCSQMWKTHHDFRG